MTFFFLGILGLVILSTTRKWTSLFPPHANPSSPSVIQLSLQLSLHCHQLPFISPLFFVSILCLPLSLFNDMPSPKLLFVLAWLSLASSSMTPRVPQPCSILQSHPGGGYTLAGSDCAAPNPITGNCSCPEGYSDIVQVLAEINFHKEDPMPFFHATAGHYCCLPV